MAASIDATVGGEGANSYVTLAQFTTYLDERPFDTTTTASAATEDERTRALIAACRRLDQEDYTGTKADSSQALKWPRYGVKDEDGRTYDSDAIPTIVQHAQMEQAIAYLTADSDPEAATGLEGFASVTVGPLQVTPRHTSAQGALPDIVRRLLRPVLTTGASTIRLVRG